uniref:CSON009665 protein n=1 Tax=Culicoides sonorensis TaxID=179676 RepID=A0A336M0R6_CULSO
MSSQSILAEGKIFIAPLIIPFTFIILALYAIHIWQSGTKKYKLSLRVPGPAPIPLLGNAHLILSLGKQAVFEKALEISKNYTGAVRAFIGYKPLFFLTHPDDAEIILNSSVHLQKSDEYRFFQPWLGNGLLISHGDTWKNHRKLIAPAFHMNVLKTFVGLFYKNSVAVVEKMRDEVGMNKEFDCHDYMSEVTVDILLQTAMGAVKREKSGFEYAMAVMKMCDILHLRHYKVWLRSDTIFKLAGWQKEQNRLLNIIHGLTGSVLDERRARFNKNLSEGKLPSPSLSEIIANDNAMQKDAKKTPAKKSTGLRDDLDDLDENDVGEKRRLAFLDLMLETAHYTNQISDEEIKNQVDTIMFEGHDTTAAGSSFVLCMLGIHKDVQVKCYDEVKRIFGDSDRPCTFADTLEMKYLERVIFETLRMYPPVPIIARRKYAMLKLKVLLSTILRNYKINSHVPEKDFKLTGDIILKRDDGFRILLEPRV